MQFFPFLHCNLSVIFTQCELNECMTRWVDRPAANSPIDLVFYEMYCFGGEGSALELGSLWHQWIMVKGQDGEGGSAAGHSNRSFT